MHDTSEAECVEGHNLMQNNLYTSFTRTDTDAARQPYPQEVKFVDPESDHFAEGVSWGFWWNEQLNILAIGAIQEGRKVKLDRRKAKKVGISRSPKTSEG